MEEIKEIKLTPYEEEIERELEAGNFVPVENPEQWKSRLQEAARRTLRAPGLVVRFTSPEARREAEELLREKLGDQIISIETRPAS